MKKTQKTPYFVKKSLLFVVFGVKWTIFMIILGCTLLMCGCAKTAPETATDAVLSQVGAVEQAIKKECPAAKIDEQMNALRATVQTQLKTCEARIETVEAQRNTWVVATIGLLIMVLAYCLWQISQIHIKTP